MGASSEHASTTIDVPEVESSAPVAPRRRIRLGVDLTMLSIVGLLLVGAIAAGGYTLYREFYSPSAFVSRYLGLLEQGRASDALAVPGVAVDAAALTAAGLPVEASDALLRSTVLSPLSDTHVVSEEAEGTATRVTVSYTAGGYPGTSDFLVQQDGWIGVAPAWRFEKSPLAVIDLTVRGSMTFAVNGFQIDKRQVSVHGADADPLAAVPLLVFSPGAYTVSVDTLVAKAPAIAVLSNVPMKSVPIALQATATPEFVDVVQTRVNEFLTACATQRVLQPTGCPFGFTVKNRVDDLPTWSIVTQPTVTVAPDGANWKIPTAQALAHIEVDIRSLYDGSVRRLDEDVPFFVTGSIVIQSDGSASISVSGLDLQ